MSCFKSLDHQTFDELLASSGTLLLFKHSSRCSISSTALNRVNSYCEGLDFEHHSFLIPVIEQRDLSNHISERLQIRHESPQLIIVKKGEAVYAESHLSIAKKGLLKALA